MLGKMLIFSAPSGAGKTTIVKNLLKENPNIEFSISACSREKRKNEIHAKDYYFFSAEEFKNKIRNNEFLEWEEVYPNRFYGTLKSELDRIWSKGKHVIFDVDVIGGINIKKQYPEKALSIFIMPPSIKELENRLRKRSTDNDKEIQTRIAKAEEEIKYAEKFDNIIINDDLNGTISEAISLTKNFLNSK
ncbi:MAG: guanylate kinase [Bacteroidales bacterium]|jgi:guanylate kinase|nr:guanylate kinase [Bacteroidales bacterium]